MTTRIDRISLRLQVRKVLGITFLWVLVGSLLFWNEWWILSAGNCPEPEFNPVSAYLISFVSTVVAGLVGGSVVVFFFGRWIRIWPYWKATAGILVAFTAVFFLVSVVGVILTAHQYSTADPFVPLSEWFTLYIGSPEFIRSYIIWLIIVLLTLAGLIVYDKYGPGTLGKVLLGKYFKPRPEERVFMFLDLRSSTGIAERLDEKQYFGLLRDVIQDVTTPILRAHGEIYQYVGDEIVISWPVGLAQQNANCLTCFFAIRDAVNRRAVYYRSKYGIVPEYKAGLHYGKVIAGEIGVVKRDITYTGDVLNTTSRIQSKCNELGVDILLSKQLLDILQLIPGQYIPEMIGTVSLRGKSQSEMLYTV